MPIRVDFTGSSTGFTPLDAGSYQAKVVKVTLSDDPGPSGFHTVVFEWLIAGTKRKVWDRYSLSPLAIWRLKKVLATLGIETPEGEFEIEPSEVVGCEATLELEVEEYNGKEKNVVADVFE
jgi:hypothetical protein